MIEVPKPFVGSLYQASANYRTHHWQADEDDVFCERCDASPHHVAALYPCGTEPPRIPIMEDSDRYR